jgi:neprilysin
MKVWEKLVKRRFSISNDVYNRSDGVHQLASSTISLKFISNIFSSSHRTLANHVILRVVDFVASQSTAALSDIYIQFQRLIDGRQDREQKWKECVDVLTKNLPFAVGSIYVKKYFHSDTKASIMEMFENIKAEFMAMIKQAEWIDESTREKLLKRLESLTPLIAYPYVDGFDEQAINEFYDDIKIDKNSYLRTLFQLRVIDADNKFRQTFTSTARENNWMKYLPPTSISAFYSESDNTIRKANKAVINF